MKRLAVKHFYGCTSAKYPTINTTTKIYDEAGHADDEHIHITYSPLLLCSEVSQSHFATPLV